jgi:hypothetical protein
MSKFVFELCFESVLESELCVRMAAYPRKRSDSAEVLRLSAVVFFSKTNF